MSSFSLKKNKISVNPAGLLAINETTVFMIAWMP